VRRIAKLGRILSAATANPWLWPIVPLIAIAAVGQWSSVTAAKVVAGACGAVGIGIAIGLTAAGWRGGPGHPSRTTPETAPRETRSSSAPPRGPSAKTDAKGSAPNSPQTVDLRGAQTVDLRGAQLANTKLVRANLRHADLRGANLKDADLTEADLTDAVLGPYDDDTHSGESA
jgi:Pentapeptide repeats (8 copies)